MNSQWLTCSESIETEYLQCMDEGRDVRKYEDDVKTITSMFHKGHTMEPEAHALWTKLQNAPIRPDYKYTEPSDLTEIRACRCMSKHKDKDMIPDKPDLYRFVYGAWLGRCSGCLFGQPVEGWYRDRIVGMMKDTDNYPPKRYFSSKIGTVLREKYRVKDEGHVYGSNTINWINNVKYGPEDDDTNYTILNLKTVEEHGKGFTSDEMAESWLMNLQFLHACTAERIAYRNFTNLILPPYSAVYENAYREWIGAQIRADLFGYISPGDPEAAAALAWKDASISHTRNGIYGEMLFAAMIARAAVSKDILDVIDAGLGEIPEHSRLFEAVEIVVSWYKDEKLTYENCLERIHTRYNEKISHDWCHTISNAMICMVGLLWGNMDFEKTIGICVSAGFDTDCNAATTGSVVGMMLGSDSLPAMWITPLHDTIKSGIDGFGMMSISGLAERMVKLAYENN